MGNGEGAHQIWAFWQQVELRLQRVWRTGQRILCWWGRLVEGGLGKEGHVWKMNRHVWKMSRRDRMWRVPEGMEVPSTEVRHKAEGSGRWHLEHVGCFFDDPADVGNLISGSSAFSKTSLNIWNFTVLILLKLDLENCDHYFASMWDECSCVVVWAFFGIAFLSDWKENWPFPVLWPLLSFPSLLAYWVWHFHSIIF